MSGAASGAAPVSGSLSGTKAACRCLPVTRRTPAAQAGMRPETGLFSPGQVRALAVHRDGIQASFEFKFRVLKKDTRALASKERRSES